MAKPIHNTIYVTQNIIDLLLKLNVVFIATLSNDINKVVGQNKWNSFSLHAKFAFEVSEEVPKVNMKKLQSILKT